MSFQDFFFQPHYERLRWNSFGFVACIQITIATAAQPKNKEGWKYWLKWYIHKHIFCRWSTVSILSTAFKTLLRELSAVLLPRFFTLILHVLIILTWSLSCMDLFACPHRELDIPHWRVSHQWPYNSESLPKNNQDSSYKSTQRFWSGEKMSYNRKMQQNMYAALQKHSSRESWDCRWIKVSVIPQFCTATQALVSRLPKRVFVCLLFWGFFCTQILGKLIRVSHQPRTVSLGNLSLLILVRPPVTASSQPPVVCH